MKKIPTLFKRDPDDMKRVTSEVNPVCQWVIDGEGVATRKYDGTCVRIVHEWYDGPRVAVLARSEVKPGKNPPPHFIPVETDPATDKTVGWEPYGQSGFAKFIDEVLGDDPSVDDWPEGTYELCGPKINGNPEGYDFHVLVPHAEAGRREAPRTYAELAAFMPGLPYEGIVWHHPDGRMAKLKRRDFPA